MFVLTSIGLALFANDAITQTRPSKQAAPTMTEIVPIAIKKSFPSTDPSHLSRTPVSLTLNVPVTRRTGPVRLSRRVSI